MPLRLDSQHADFADQFRSLLALKREAAQDVEEAVRGIIADVVARGDRALFELTTRFDRVDLAKIGLRVASAEIDAAEKSCDENAIAALKVARDRIEAYHRRQKPSDDRFTDSLGVEMGAKLWISDVSHAAAESVADQRTLIHNGLPLEVLVTGKGEGLSHAVNCTYGFVLLLRPFASGADDFLPKPIRAPPRASSPLTSSSGSRLCAPARAICTTAPKTGRRPWTSWSSTVS